jgi:hypothetical protein
MIVVGNDCLTFWQDHKMDQENSHHYCVSSKLQEGMHAPSAEHPHEETPSHGFPKIQLDQYHKMRNNYSRTPQLFASSLWACIPS